MIRTSKKRRCVSSREPSYSRTLSWRGTYTLNRRYDCSATSLLFLLTSCTNVYRRHGQSQCLNISFVFSKSTSQWSPAKGKRHLWVQKTAKSQTNFLTHQIPLTYSQGRPPFFKCNHTQPMKCQWNKYSLKSSVATLYRSEYYSKNRYNMKYKLNAFISVMYSFYYHCYWNDDKSTFDFSDNDLSFFFFFQGQSSMRMPKLLCCPLSASATESTLFPALCQMETLQR